jgi:hypothetical protein
MKMEPLLTNDSNKLIIKESDIIDISKGPQFKTKGGTILATIFLMFLIISIASLFQAEFLLSLIFFIISIIIFSLVIDIHGIEVDRSIHKIRDYKAFLWFKIGKWSNINEFRTIYLTQKNVIIRTSKYSDHRSDTYHYYHIKLVDELNKKEIFLAEYKNYYKAQKISKSISDATGLEFKDFLKRDIKRK